MISLRETPEEFARSPIFRQRLLPSLPHLHAVWKDESAWLA